MELSSKCKPVFSLLQGMNNLVNVLSLRMWILANEKLACAENFDHCRERNTVNGDEPTCIWKDNGL